MPLPEEPTNVNVANAGFNQPLLGTLVTRW